jgi:hypothetical protein
MLAAALGAPPATFAPSSYLSILPAEGAALIFLFALLIDTWALGGPRLAPWFDRIAFIGWTAVIAAGFEGAGLTGAVQGLISGVFQALAGVWNAPLFVGFVRVGPQIIGFLVLAIVVGCLVPNRVRFLGKLSHLEFSHLRQARAVLVTTGVSRKTQAAVEDTAGKSTIKKLFPGEVNVGLIICAVLLVSVGPMINGGFGTAMRGITKECVILSGDAVHPVLRWMALA